jgi:hypothetical protein
MHIQTDRALVPAAAPAVRYLHVRLMHTAARDLTFEITGDPGLECAVMNELPADRHVDRLRVRIGRLAADQEVSLVMAVAFKGTQAEGTELGVACRALDFDGTLVAEAVTIRWQAVDAVRDQTQPVARDVRVAVAMVLASRARRAALTANANREFADARRLLRDAVNDLRALAPGDALVVPIIDQLHRDELELGRPADPER